MPKWIRDLDDLVRGRKSDPRLLAEGTGHLPLGGFLAASVVLGMVYGVFMGLFGVLNRPTPCWEQLAASTLKVPALFLLTLAVTFPSLYVFSALLGAKLNVADALRVAVAAITVTLAVLAAFGPITGFFTLNTDNHAFMVLLNVVFFAIAGLIGLGFLSRMLHRVELARVEADEPYIPPVEPEPGADVARPVEPLAGVPPQRSRAARAVFKIWLVLYAVVGAQMAWVLRPFIGGPGAFTWFRPRSGNFFQAVFGLLVKLMSGK
jgi:hypothetical protein